MNETGNYFLGLVLNAVYSIQKTAVTQNKIAYICTKSSTLPQDYINIQQILEAKKTKKFKFQLVNICDDLSGDASFLKRAMHTFKCMHFLPSCRVVIYDDNESFVMKNLIHKNSLTRICLNEGLEGEALYYKDGAWNRLVLKGSAEESEETMNPTQIIANLAAGELGA